MKTKLKYLMIIIVVIGILLFSLLYFTIDQVKVEGNYIYSEEEVESFV